MFTDLLVYSMKNPVEFKCFQAFQALAKLIIFCRVILILWSADMVELS